MVVNGINFPSQSNSSVSIGTQKAQIISQNSTQIVVISPALASGFYPLVINCSRSIGFAR